MADLSEAQVDEIETQQEEKSLAERLAANEPIYEPTTLNALADADLPLRGPLRQRIIENARTRSRQRRTIQGLSNRVAANIAAPITEIVEQSIRERVTERIQESATRIAANSGSGE